MTSSFHIGTAAELMADPDREARWRERESIGAAARAALREILARFVADGGPVEVSSLPHPAAAVAELDARDLVYLHEGRVVLAYPWSGTPTAFVVRLTGGRQRWACCAIDALGIAAMLGEPVQVESRCHHCGEPLRLDVTPEGPAANTGVMAWVGKREDLRGKACTAL
jgi:alkylmercury lyase-like protein